MRYIQLHGYILCPFSDAEVMRCHRLFSGHIYSMTVIREGGWVGEVIVFWHVAHRGFLLNICQNSAIKGIGPILFRES